MRPPTLKPRAERRGFPFALLVPPRTHDHNPLRIMRGETDDTRSQECPTRGRAPGVVPSTWCRVWRGCVRPSMAKRVCLEPGCPTITDRARCPVHARAKDRERGTRQERGYDTRHDREAKRVRDLIRAGHLILCWRCGEPITDPDDCHLGHDDRDRSITRGAEHGRACNLRAAGRARHIAPDD